MHPLCRQFVNFFFLNDYSKNKKKHDEEIRHAFFVMIYRDFTD